jgi:hypothetical protein
MDGFPRRAPPRDSRMPTDASISRPPMPGVTTVAIVRGAVTCPVAAYKAWIKAANITAGPVFRPIAKGERPHRAPLCRTPHATTQGHAVLAALLG